MLPRNDSLKEASVPESDPKDLYTTKTTPMLIQVPRLSFACVHGQGDPNGPDFAMATSALYSFSYAVKMSYKGPHKPEGYTAYKVYPLEGVWDLADKQLAATNKSNYVFDLMIRQPSFVTPDVFRFFLAETRKKKPNPWLERMEFIQLEEGLCCQMLHLGPYDDEPASFARMQAFCEQQGYLRAERTHREIYLNDPRRVAPEKIRTILRFKVGLVG